jgi:hypothetical protein
MKVLILSLLLLCIMPGIYSAVNEWGYDDEKWVKPKKGDKLVASANSKAKAYNKLHNDLDGYEEESTDCGVQMQKTNNILFYTACLQNSKDVQNDLVHYVMIRKTIEGVSYWKYVHQFFSANADI